MVQRRQQLEEHFIHRFRFVEAARARATWIDEKLRCFEPRTGHDAAFDTEDGAGPRRVGVGAVAVQG